MPGRADAFEVNFDGICGPSYNHAATAPGGPGNLASRASRGRPSNPRTAALEGLGKIRTLMELGVRQAVLPPLLRPKLEPLLRIGLIKDPALLRADDADALARHLAIHAARAPHLLAACFSGASVWTANWATVSPSTDTADRKLHLTPANQNRAFHRSLEADDVYDVLSQIFAAKSFFAVHEPLPSSYPIGDEGAANHFRLAGSHGAKGLNVFVYGRTGFEEPDASQRFLPRQTLEASQAVARLHELDPFRTLFLRQSSAALNAGIFHNDVAFVSNLDLLFCHEMAFADPLRALCDVQEAFRQATDGASLRAVIVRNDEVSLDEAAVSYLFKSQIVKDRDGRTLLIAPRQCATVPSVAALLDRLTGDAFDEVVHVDVPSSMRGGGGPSCLRLRIVLDEKQEAAIGARVLLDEDLLDEIVDLVRADYPTHVDESMFADAGFLKTCFDATRRLYAIMALKLPGF